MNVLLDDETVEAIRTLESRGYITSCGVSGDKPRLSVSLPPGTCEHMCRIVFEDLRNERAHVGSLVA